MDIAWNQCISGGLAAVGGFTLQKWSRSVTCFGTESSFGKMWPVDSLCEATCSTSWQRWPFEGNGENGIVAACQMRSDARTTLLLTPLNKTTHHRLKPPQDPACRTSPSFQHLLFPENVQMIFYCVAFWWRNYHPLWVDICISQSSTCSSNKPQPIPPRIYSCCVFFFRNNKAFSLLS